MSFQPKYNVVQNVAMAPLSVTLCCFCYICVTALKDKKMTFKTTDSALILFLEDIAIAKMQLAVFVSTSVVAVTRKLWRR